MTMLLDALILISFYVAAAGYDNHDCLYLDATRFLALPMLFLLLLSLKVIDLCPIWFCCPIIFASVFCCCWWLCCPCCLWDLVMYISWVLAAYFMRLTFIVPTLAIAAVFLLIQLHWIYGSSSSSIGGLWCSGSWCCFGDVDATSWNAHDSWMYCVSSYLSSHLAYFAGCMLIFSCLIFASCRSVMLHIFGLDFFLDVPFVESNKFCCQLKKKKTMTMLSIWEWLFQKGHTSPIPKKAISPPLGKHKRTTMMYKFMCSFLLRSKNQIFQWCDDSAKWKFSIIRVINKRNVYLRPPFLLDFVRLSFVDDWHLAKVI